MCRIIFIGDVHNKGTSIIENYARFKKKNGEIGTRFALLLEVGYDGNPEENSNSAITVVASSKPQNGDRAFLIELANKASVCYGFDSDDHSIYSLARQNQQFKNIKKLAKEIIDRDKMDVLIIVGAAHLELNSEHSGWKPHHEKLDGALGKSVYCYSMFEDGSKLDYDD